MKFSIDLNLEDETERADFLKLSEKQARAKYNLKGHTGRILTKQLFTFAIMAESAARDRKTGNINAATIKEEFCSKIYQKLIENCYCW